MQMRTDRLPYRLRPRFPTFRHSRASREVDSHFKCNTLSQNVAAGVLSARHLRGVLLEA